MTKSGGYLAGQKAKPPLTAGVADVSIPRPRRGAGRQRARAVRETKTQKPPLTAKSVRAILRLCTLQMPCPRRDTGGPGVRVVRATGTQKPPLTAKSVRAVGRLGSVRASSACPRRNANRRVRRPGHPSDGNAKTAADREACQGGWGLSALQAPVPEETSAGGRASGAVRATGTQNRRRPRSLSGRLGSVRASSARPRRNADGRARRPGHPSDGSAKTAADREACQGGLGLSALQAPVPEGTPVGGQNVSRFAGQNAKTAAGRAARQGDLGSVHASKAPPPEWRRGLCAVVPQPMQAYTSKLSCTSAAVRGISKAVEPPAGIASHQALSPERSTPSPSR